jgi:hypothetical protein
MTDKTSKEMKEYGILHGEESLKELKEWEETDLDW